MDAETRRAVAFELSTAFILFAFFVGVTLATRKPAPPYIHAAVDGDRVFRLVTDWEFCGPMEPADGDLEKVWAVSSYPDGPVRHCDETFAWKPIERLIGESHTAIETAYPGRENVFVLARVRLSGKGSGVREIRVGSDDGAIAWFNGVEAYRSATTLRSYVPDQDRFEVNLTGGDDELLFKVLNGASAWWFAVRLEDPAL